MNAVLIFLLGLTATHVAAQATAFTLSRFGSQPVRDHEVAQIAELVTSTGKRPWLLRSPHSMIPNVRVASLFLEPDVQGARVHRGRMLSLVADVVGELPVVPVVSPWRIRESHSYAYIPIAGRRAGEIRGEDDLSWPFIVQGQIDDDTLISIVEFIRSQPPIPIPLAFHKEVPAAPIAAIQHGDAATSVWLSTGDFTWARVWLVRKDGQWVITRSESAIA